MSNDYSSDKIIIGGGDKKTLSIAFKLRNTGYDSQKTTLTLIYPNMLHFEPMVTKISEINGNKNMRSLILRGEI